MQKPAKHQKIFLKGKERQEDIEGYSFDDGKCQIRFVNSNKTYSYNQHDVKVINSVLSDEDASNCFEYLKELASITGLKAQSVEGEEFNALFHYYSNINFIDDDSLLGAFLSGELPSDNYGPYINEPDIIYPFGFNGSQTNAVTNALNNRISVIEGPPGTGKTQTILNIIANIVINGGSVAVTSSNNSATQNVFDKLAKYGTDFIVASLGSKKNKINFIENQQPLPNLASWELSREEFEETQQHISQLFKTLQAKLKFKVELSNRTREYEALELEYKHFVEQYKNTETGDLKRTFKIRSFQEATRLWIAYRSFKVKNWFLTTLLLLYELLTTGRSNLLKAQKFVKEHSLEQLINFFQSSFYQLKMEHDSDYINLLKRELEEFDFDTNMKLYSDLSMKVFRHGISKKFTGKKRGKYSLQELRQQTTSFLKDYPIILSTTYSINNSLSPNTEFDYLIIDEASQVNVCTGALALSCAKRVVIVGDTNQLTHVVDNKTRVMSDDVFCRFNPHERYNYAKESLLSIYIRFFKEVPKTLLKEHYRCAPKIIDFCNKKFYGGELIVMTENKSERSPLIVYKTVPGNHQRNRMNQRQIDVIKSEIIKDQKLNVRDNSIGIVTPYRSQTNKLQKSFEGTGIEAYTVDKFQGREKNIVILSTVDNQISEFADERNRLNVAISRAIDQLILVVSDHDSVIDTNIGDLIKYIEYNNMTIVESKVNSVFDYLYNSYAEERKNLLSKNKKISEFDSENLMYALILKVLKDEGIYDLGVSSHVPLNMVIRDKSFLNEKERKYASNQLSHVDFLMYDSASKLPKLAIEVDGVRFHKEGSLQAERDRIKNSIFEKAGIPLLRFKTDGSGEEQVLRERLNRL